MPEEPATPAPAEDEPSKLSAAKKQFIGFILLLTFANIIYRFIYAAGYEKTSLLYIGLPAILIIGLTTLPRSKSAVGMLIKGSTLAMLVACVILPEGLVCLLFAVPLVSLIALLIGGPIDLARRFDKPQDPTLMVISLPLLILSLEGVVGSPFDTSDIVTASITVNAPLTAVARALAKPPDFNTDLPPFLKVGFNRPVSATGSGIDVGDRRTIDFTGGTHDDHPLRLFGITGERSVDHHSEMRLAVVDSQPGRVVFSINHDMTMLSRWADLKRAVVTWEAINATTTRVSWTLAYERLLFPTAYFAPLQRYGMDQAARYLLETVIAEQLQ